MTAGPWLRRTRDDGSVDDDLFFIHPPGVVSMVVLRGIIISLVESQAYSIQEESMRSFSIFNIIFNFDY